MKLDLPQRVFVQTDGLHACSSGARDGVFSAGDVEVILSHVGDRLRVQLSAPRTAVRRIALRWPMQLSADAKVYQDHWERGYGDMGWYPPAGDHVLPWYFIAHEAGRLHGRGVQTGPAAFAHWRVEPDGIVLVLDVRSGGVGVELGGRTLDVATVLADERQSDDAFGFACDFCRAMCPSPRLAKEPVYGGNDFYYAYTENSEEQIVRDANNIAKWTSGLSNRPFMVIDDGWQLTRLRNGINGGPWLPNSRFSDMRVTADRIRQADVRPGIWVRPLLTVERVPERWMLSATRFVNSYAAITQILDPSVPEVLELVRRDVHRCTQEWGYELLKHDWTTWDLLGKWGNEMQGQCTIDGWQFADRSVTTAEVILRLYRCIREAAGDAVLIGCNTISHLAAGIHELQRTGDDTSGHFWERTRRMGINTLAMRMPQHNAFYACDADCVGLTTKVPWAFNKQWLHVLAHSGTPLFVSADPEAVGPEQEAALREAFQAAARPLPPARPLDWQQTRTPQRWQTEGLGVVEYQWWDDQDPFSPGIPR